MKFCPYCAGKVVQKIPPGDAFERNVCSQCDAIHYDNPRVIVSTCLYYVDKTAANKQGLENHDGKILWVKRGIEPAKGKWMFPGGFFENGETLRECAAREVYEEVGIELELSSLLPIAMGSLMQINQLHIAFCHVCKEMFEPRLTEEVVGARWCSETEAPWNSVAFPEAIDEIHNTYRRLNNDYFSLWLDGDVSVGTLYSKNTEF